MSLLHSLIVGEVANDVVNEDIVRPFLPLLKLFLSNTISFYFVLFRFVVLVSC